MLTGVATYVALTGLVFVPPIRPPVVAPGILAGNLTDKAGKIATAENKQARVDYAIAEGFCSGFSNNYRNAFDSKYYG